MAETVKRILFLAANPQATSRLRLDEEAREIQQGLERSRWRDRFAIQTRWAVDPEVLRRSLLDIEPHIVHFSGHGVGADGLVLHAAEGQTKLASSKALANLFGLFAVECVLLNAMVGGHPHLVRVALYDLARGQSSLARLLQVAPTEEGSYEDHLRRHLANLHRNDKLVQAVKTMINSDQPVVIGTDEAFQLDSMGLVRRRGMRQNR